MDFEEAKEYTANIYNAIAKGGTFEENGDEHRQIMQICKLTRKTFKNCTCKFSDRLKDTVTELMLFFRKNKEFPTSKYEVVRGVAFVVDGIAYTHENMTDSVAERLLSERDVAHKYITRMEQVEEPEQKQELPVVKPKKRKK